MSLQDDIFDVAAALEGKPEAEQFECIVVRLSALEADNERLLARDRWASQTFSTLRRLLMDL